VSRGAKRWIVGTIVSALALIAAVVALTRGSGDTAGSAAATTAPATKTAKVQRRDLLETQNVSGTIGYGATSTIRLGSGSASGATGSASGSGTGASNGAVAAAQISPPGGGSTATTTGPTDPATSATSTPVTSTPVTSTPVTSTPVTTTKAASTASTGNGSTGSAASIITALPEVGTTIDRGGSLAEVNGQPSAFLLFGTRPMYRTFTSGITDGPDVTQLEENLVALGMATTSTLTVDDTFTSATTTAIKRWQKSLGLDQTGTLATNEIVFAAGAVRVASHIASPGDNASGAILAVTSTTRSVRANLSSAQLALAKEGQLLDVQLPDGSVVRGDVTSIGTATTATSGNGPNAQTTTSYPMVVKVPDTVTAPDGSTVSISLISTKATGVLAVPVKALVALAEGGYGVEKLQSGSSVLVGVKPGAFASGFVEVTGNVVEGDEVVVP
jgi:hypothetical protein